MEVAKLKKFIIDRLFFTTFLEFVTSRRLAFFVIVTLPLILFIAPFLVYSFNINTILLDVFDLVAFFRIALIVSLTLLYAKYHYLTTILTLIIMYFLLSSVGSLFIFLDVYGIPLSIIVAVTLILASLAMLSNSHKTEKYDPYCYVLYYSAIYAYAILSLGLALYPLYFVGFISRSVYLSAITFLALITYIASISYNGTIIPHKYESYNARIIRLAATLRYSLRYHVYYIVITEFVLLFFGDWVLEYISYYGYYEFYQLTQLTSLAYFLYFSKKINEIDTQNIYLDTIENLSERMALKNRLVLVGYEPFIDGIIADYLRNYKPYTYFTTQDHQVVYIVPEILLITESEHADIRSGSRGFKEYNVEGKIYYVPVYCGIVKKTRLLKILTKDSVVIILRSFSEIVSILTTTVEGISVISCVSDTESQIFTTDLSLPDRGLVVYLEEMISRRSYPMLYDIILQKKSISKIFLFDFSDEESSTNFGKTIAFMIIMGLLDSCIPIAVLPSPSICVSMENKEKHNSSE